MPILPDVRHELFAQGLAQGKKKNAAYVAAGFESDRGNAARLSRNPDIQDRIDELMQGTVKRHEHTIDAVLHELARIGFANMLDYIEVQDDGTAVIDLAGLDRAHAAAIGELTVEQLPPAKGDDAAAEPRVQKVRFKLLDKLGALEKLGKHLGLSPSRFEHSGPGGGPIETKDHTAATANEAILRLLTKAGMSAEAIGPLLVKALPGEEPPSEPGD